MSSLDHALHRDSKRSKIKKMRNTDPSILNRKKKKKQKDLELIIRRKQKEGLLEIE